jgi:RNA polymerase sigma-70 factor (ECF subfamily)
VSSASAAVPEAADLEAARRHDEAAFERLIAPYRGALHAHCYRMLGSVPDAEDAVQEALLRAWRGLAGFEGRSSLRSWLYRIATNVCLKTIERRPARMLPMSHGAPSDPHEAPAGPLLEDVWIDPYPEQLPDGLASPEARFEQREAVELAFVATVQHLPARQRAVLLLRDVLGFSPAEIAVTLDTTPASVYSALQRARGAVQERLPARSQQATLRSLDDTVLRDLVERYMQAWEEADVDALVEMLTDDAVLAMPPRPSWYRGRAAVGEFLAAWPLSRPGRWRLVPVHASGQIAFAAYGLGDAASSWTAHAIEVLTLDRAGAVEEIHAFQDPAAFARFGLPMDSAAPADL